MPREVLDPDLLRHVARAILPSELGTARQQEVVEAFIAWLEDYREGAEVDHNVAFPQPGWSPPSPAPGYAQDLERLDGEAQQRLSRPLAELDDAGVRSLIAAALDAVVPETRELPPRPDDSHVAVGLLAFYYTSAAANDRCYRAAIGMKTARDLYTHLEAPDP